MNKIKCIIVDDEPLARQLLESYVAEIPFLHLVAQCRNAIEAIQVLENENVDLLFLDIKMPNMTGMELSKIVHSQAKIIFTTAFEKYAVEGYKVNAIDYLLKPIDYDEFLHAATKAQIIINALHDKSLDDYILVKSDYKVQQIALKDILYIEGIKDYIIIHRINGEKITSLMSMKAVEEKLPSKYFMRVHRSYMVNVNQIKTIEKSRIIFGKVYIPVSDKYKSNFQAFLSSRFLNR